MTGAERLAQLREALEPFEDYARRKVDGRELASPAEALEALEAEIERMRWEWASENTERTNELMALREAGEALAQAAQHHRENLCHAGRVDTALARWREVAGDGSSI